MGPTVAIIERYRDIAAALEEVTRISGCTPILMSDVADLADLPRPPVAIVVRIATELLRSPHVGLVELTSNRPKVLALASSDADVAEAERLGCEVVLKHPQQVRGLYEALKRVAHSESDDWRDERYT